MASNLPIVEVTAGGNISTYAVENVLRYAYIINTIGCDEFRMDVECSWDNWKGNDYLKNEFKVSHGYVGGDQSEKFEVVATYAKEVYGMNVSLNVSGYCSGWTLNELAAKDTAYQDKVISDIVTEIATNSGFTASVDATTSKYTLFGAGYTVGEFLYQECFPRAGPNYYFCFRPGKQLFLKKYPTSGSASYDMSRFAQQPYFVYNRIVGSSNWTAIGWDLNSDMPLIQNVSFSSTGITPYASNGFEFKKPVMLKSMGSTRTRPTITNQAKGLFNKDPWMNYLVLPVYGDPKLVPPFIVTADIIRPGTSNKRFTAGRYLAESVAHVISRDGSPESLYISYIICSRRGFQ